MNLGGARPSGTDQPVENFERRGRVRRVLLGGGLALLGLVFGMAIALALRGDRGVPKADVAPSVKRFPFPTELSEVVSPAPEPDPLLGSEPPDARAALALMLQSMVEGKPELAYGILDSISVQRFPSLSSWVAAQADGGLPMAYEIGPGRQQGEDAVDFEVLASHEPSLDPFRGLVPSRSQSVWHVQREQGRWRVGAEPLSQVAILPPDATAPEVVRVWVSRLAVCDQAGAAAFQVGNHLYGPTALADSPCETRGSWTVEQPVSLDNAPDPKAFLAAFGPDARSWARLVPVRGPGVRFFAAVAPLGEAWRVMGVAVAG